MSIFAGMLSWVDFEQLVDAWCEVSEQLSPPERKESSEAGDLAERCAQGYDVETDQGRLSRARY
jgi:hypothetical protein